MTASWKQIEGEEFVRSGLLYYVNSTVLWPLGVALYVTKTDTGYEPKIGVMQLTEAEAITDGMPEEEDHPRYRITKWIAQRLASMSDEERALAHELLKDPMNVAAFLTEDPDANRLARPVVT